MYVEQGVAEFRPDTRTDNTAGSFEIQTDNTFTNLQNFLVGLGQVDTDEQVVPVATVSALMDYHIYYCAT